MPVLVPILARTDSPSIDIHTVAHLNHPSGFIIFGTLVAVGAGAIFYGYKTTAKLNQLRAKLKSSGPATAYCGPQGMRLDSFNAMASKANGTTFSQEELVYVSAAL